MKRKRNSLRDDEFITEIYRRAEALTRQRKRRKALALALSCCAAVFCLSAIIFHIAGGLLHNGDSIPLSAAVFIENSIVGGYLLTGVLSFTGGVFATLFSIRRQRKNKGGSNDENE
jgi:hypothetical protein